MATKKKTNQGNFLPVNPSPDFPAMERELLADWHAHGIVKKYLTKNANSTKRFSFLDGPITANNPMGVHHGWGRTYKDIWQRFFNMKGYKGRFQNGFDCQGLWVEVEVERELGLKTKLDIENLIKGDPAASIAKFVELCRERVLKFSAIQTEQSKRLGYFMDWDNSYYTMSEENNYLIWHFLKKCFEMGLIYKGMDSVPWCPRCETAISQHEILTEEYQDITHTAVYIKYPIVGRNGEYLLVWTTTPWTLPGNVAIAVNPKLIYSRVRVGSETYYIARDRIIPVLGAGLPAGRQGLEVLDEITGDRLLNIAYRGPFDGLPRVASAKLNNPRGFHIVVDGGEFVTNEEGTGLVHIAPGAGHEDFALSKKERLPLILLIDEEGKFLPDFGAFSGKMGSEQILSWLKVEGPSWLFKQEKYMHRYPVCWRCKAELLFRAVDEWYIAMDPVREKLASVTRKINWLPSWGLDRELDWLKNMGDWLISKKRYWGLALPIWECDKVNGGCGEFQVIGSRDELKEKATQGWDKFDGKTPHKPWVDAVKIDCQKCGQQMSRIPDVGNPWLDAGIVPFSTITGSAARGKVSYLEQGDRKEYWRQWFPADLITESFPGQFKNWFYSLLTMSTVLENKEPMKSVLGFASLLAEDGRPMHKSWGNAIEFNEGADKIGADVMRWMFAKQDPARNLLFGYKVADETRRAFHLPLWNIYNFFVTYATFDGWKPDKGDKVQGIGSSNILDKWITARLKQVSSVTTRSLEQYDATTAVRVIEEFVNDLSAWYIRRSRDRVGGAATNQKDKGYFYETTYFVLVTLSKILMPFTPFLAEAIYKNLTRGESVNLEDWPEFEDLEKREEAIIENMAWIRKAAEAGHACRKNADIKVRQPLAKATVGAEVLSPTQPFLSVLAEELNVKSVVWKKQRVDLLQVSLQTKLSKELIEEGKTRDLVREIQDLRRKGGLGVSDRVKILSPWLPEDRKLLSWVKTKTLADNLSHGVSLEVKKVK